MAINIINMHTKHHRSRVRLEGFAGQMWLAGHQ